LRLRDFRNGQTARGEPVILNKTSPLGNIHPAAINGKVQS
jgi:hypothetical protein